MKKQLEHSYAEELHRLCATVKELALEEKYEQSIPQICNAMQKYPHDPIPHNLMGIIMEHMGDHKGAMKHFRAAWALDPTYRPANHNLHTYGTFFSGGGCAFDEDDVPAQRESNIEIVYNEYGVGRAVSKTVVEYDARGIGHAVRR